MKKHTPQEWADFLGTIIIQDDDGFWNAYEKMPDCELDDPVYGTRLVYSQNVKHLSLVVVSDSGGMNGFRMYKNALVETPEKSPKNHIWKPSNTVKEGGGQREGGERVKHSKRRDIATSREVLAIEINGQNVVYDSMTEAIEAYGIPNYKKLASLDKTGETWKSRNPSNPVHVCFEILDDESESHPLPTPVENRRGRA